MCLIHNLSLIILLVMYVTVYIVHYSISEFCKSKDASYNVAELLSWHKFVIQRRILAAILKDNPGVRREGHRSARHDISRTGILIQSPYNVHSVWELSWLDQYVGRIYWILWLLSFVTKMSCPCSDHLEAVYTPCSTYTFQGNITLFTAKMGTEYTYQCDNSGQKQKPSVTTVLPTV